jgi:hypothetical protein
VFVTLYIQVEFILRTKKLHIVKASQVTVHSPKMHCEEGRITPQVNIVVGRTIFRGSGSTGAILLQQVFVIDIADGGSNDSNGSGLEVPTAIMLPTKSINFKLRLDKLGAECNLDTNKFDHPASQSQPQEGLCNGT